MVISMEYGLLSGIVFRVLCGDIVLSCSSIKEIHIMATFSKLDEVPFQCTRMALSFSVSMVIHTPGMD